MRIAIGGGLTSVACLVMASCTIGPTTTPDSGITVDCVPPPVAEIGLPSEVLMTLDPNPARAGAVVELSVSDEGLLRDPVVGAALEWQCWDGSAWVRTHQLLRGEHTGGEGPETNNAPPGVSVTMIAIGIPLPNVDVILIPDVEPGIYRIYESAIAGPNNQTFEGFLIVEVS